MEIGKPEVMGNMNKNTILRLLRNEGPLSRADIARKLDISFPSISSNVKVLIEAGLVLEIGEGEGNNGLGRKSTLLSFNANKGHVIGVDAGRSQVRAMCSDLLGNPISTVNKDCSNSNNGEYMYDQIRNTIHEVIQSSGIDVDTLECICIGIPGIWDEAKGKNRLAPFIDSWEDIKVHERIEAEFKTKVIVDNGVNLGAIGEKWKGSAAGYKDVVYINYGVGIGSGIILNDELYRGRNNAAGEIGYMTLDKFYLRRVFQEEGALEELISGASLSDRMKSFSDNKKDYYMEEILKMAELSDPYAKKIIGETVVYLSMAIVNILSVINPEIVVLSGRVGKAIGQKYREQILDIIAAHVPYVPELTISKMGDKENVIGAIGVGIRYAKSNFEFAG